MRRPGLSHTASAILLGCVLLICAREAASKHAQELGPALLSIGVAISVATAVGLWRVGRELALERRLRAASAPGEVSGIAVRWLDGDAPFVAGIARPTIYWPEHLRGALPSREQWAMVLHEEHHRRHSAPRRLLMLGICGMLIPVRPLRRHIEALRAELEIEADAAALAAGATRGSLAAALLRLAPANASHGAGFTAAAELRVRNLLGEAPARQRTPARRSAWFAPSVLLSLALACAVVVG